MPLEVILTDWAFQSYLDLKRQKVFTPTEYRKTLRADAELLKTGFPADPRFGNSLFWGPATIRGGVNVPDGYKMKWHNIGPGRVQLRLCVAILNQRAYLCHAYVKGSQAKDHAQAALLLSRISDIRAGRYGYRGKL